MPWTGLSTDDPEMGETPWLSDDGFPIQLGRSNQQLQPILLAGSSHGSQLGYNPSGFIYMG